MIDMLGRATATAGAGWSQHLASRPTAQTSRVDPHYLDSKPMARLKIAPLSSQRMCASSSFVAILSVA
jgi:hypothetical protein